MKGEGQIEQNWQVNCVQGQDMIALQHEINEQLIKSQGFLYKDTNQWYLIRIKQMF